jgi:TRAP-type uncharacterized transport system substrate-binding protein
MLGLGWSGLIKGLAALLCILGVVSLALIYFFPAPPSKIIIATSFKGGHYVDLFSRYQEILARSHLKVEQRLTKGAGENLTLLNDPASGIQIGFMQGGISDSKQSPDLLSLGRIDYQLLWLFHPATETLDDLTQLKGKRIALGAVGSGSRAVTEKILGIGGINKNNTTLLPLAGEGAVNALKDGKIDAFFFAFDPASSIFQSLIRMSVVR